MTPEQFDRWKDFAVRMARHAFPSATAERRGKIERQIAAYFSWYERDSDFVASIIDWDSSPAYIGDDVSRALENHYHEKSFTDGRVEPRGNKFENQVTCCIRAGLDRAAEPSGGVVGFTVGDLRAMYPEGIPEWVIDGYEPPITADTPNEAGVWL